MPSVCFYFQVHQPCRLRHYTVFDQDHRYFDGFKNKAICRKVANKCYLPTNRLILDLINQHEGRFKVAYSITGVLLEQLAEYAPEVLSTFDALARTGCVEFLSETYYHSLSFLYSREEFTEQILKHRRTIEKLFNYKTKVFRNTELIYSNDLVDAIESMGIFDGVLTEGADRILNGRSPNFIYNSPRNKRIKLLLKNYALSDDIAFRFSNRGWNEWPLMAGKFSDWVSRVNGNGYVVNLFMDYETFGEHQWKDTGIFDFMRHLPGEIMRNQDNNFKTPSEVIGSYPATDVIDVPGLISWADMERDLSAWLGNPMQSNALHEVYRMERNIKKTGDKELLADWRKLQTSDHFYYMCTKYFSDGDVHKYFNPYDSPYDSYINYMNVMGNLEKRCKKKLNIEAEQLEV
ncbi:MAG: glycoside hydrolase family 57 protein [Phycisphaerae bacterium]|nr:glycoside hydrolase family 57 protein [Phycisphaerae bacterium]